MQGSLELSTPASVLSPRPPHAACFPLTHTTTPVSALNFPFRLDFTAESLNRLLNWNIECGRPDRHAGDTERMRKASHVSTFQTRHPCCQMLAVQKYCHLCWALQNPASFVSPKRRLQTMQPQLQPVPQLQFQQLHLLTAHSYLLPSFCTDNEQLGAIKSQQMSE